MNWKCRVVFDGADGFFNGSGASFWFHFGTFSITSTSSSLTAVAC